MSEKTCRTGFLAGQLSVLDDSDTMGGAQIESVFDGPEPGSEPPVQPVIDHAKHSMLRERIVEHMFIGEALRLYWVNGVTDIEVLRSESDFLRPDLSFEHFLWFGGPPGKPLQDIQGFKVAKHTKGNAGGTKAERPDHRVICRAQFEKLASLDAVLVHLFGPLI